MVPGARRRRGAGNDDEKGFDTIETRLSEPLLTLLAPSNTGGHASQAAIAAGKIGLLKKPILPPPCRRTHLQARRQPNVDGEVDAADERAVIETAAGEFKRHAPKLMAARLGLRPDPADWSITP
jgi:hypothetical protein